ncbi:acyltransferase family protein [Sphingomonas fuzhouensis]|uniref:acyltransferase family protein n=1 Tax=Sphingomonas fuzhouensis TaxID=3106033 RepID=UPI002AFF6B59|nr:acyltransferase [Sphingomonas sp. SGZ-02]
MASATAWVDERGKDAPLGEKGRGYPALDGFRGLAAIIVVYYHVMGLATAFQSPGLGHGHLAVDLFFALSGFVLFHAYFDRFRQGLSPRKLLILRLIRLYPLYAVGLFIGISAQIFILLIDPAQAMSPLRLLANIVTGLFILPSYPPRDALFPLNGPFWTLMFELIVNILMAILWRHIGFRRIAILCVVLAAILAAYVIGHGDAAAGDTWKGLVFGFVRCASSFCIGILVYRIAHGRRITMIPHNLLFGILCAAIVGFLLWPPPVAYAAIYDLVFILLISPLSILLGSRIVLTGPMVRLCTLLGVTSYAFYVTHCPMIRVLLLWCDRTGAIDYRDHLVLFASGYTLVFVILAYALDRFYDFPVRRWLSRRAAIRVSRPVPDHGRAG